MSRHLTAPRGRAALATATPSLRPPHPSHAMPSAQAVSALGSGQALDRRTSAEMSARFGHDFSHVRIHTDSRAEESAAALGANAYALGSDIVFGAGKFQPGSSDGERLLAHELTHIVQQARFGPGDWGRQSRAGDASEREADALAGQALAGQRVQAQAAPGAAVARDEGGAGGAPADEQQEQNAGGGAAGGGQADVGVGGGSAGSIPDSSGADNAGASGPDAWNQMKNNPVLNGTPYAVATDNSWGLSAIPQAVADANGASSVAGGLGGFNQFIAPLGMASNAVSLAQDLHKDRYADVLADTAGIGSSAITIGQGLGWVGATGTAATVGAALGAGAGGYAAGKLLAEHTEVGADSADIVGGIDKWCNNAPGQSTLRDLDDSRKKFWNDGGFVNDVAALGLGIAEGGVGLAGALGGLAQGAWHGVKSLAQGAAEADQSPGGAGF